MLKDVRKSNVGRKNILWTEDRRVNKNFRIIGIFIAPSFRVGDGNGINIQALAPFEDPSKIVTAH